MHIPDVNISHSPFYENQWRRKVGAKGGMRPGRHCARGAFGGEFGNSAVSGELAFALQNGFGGFVSRLLGGDR